VFFKTKYDEIKIKKISYDVISVTSPNNVTKVTSQKFSILGHF